MSLSFPFTVRDPVHGLMSFTDLERQIVDLPIFQRLRGLKQSSLAHLTYPTALTTRFEHSLGSAHVAGRILAHLRSTYPEEIQGIAARVAVLYPETTAGVARDEILDAIGQGVRLAALLHDIGHLPFSHCFEEEFQLSLQQSSLADRWGSAAAARWNALGSKEGAPKFHEFLGAQIAEHHGGIGKIMERNAPPLVRELTIDILNSSTKRQTTIQRALGRIVHGEIDADRIDFVRRDGRMAGSGFGSFDIDRIIRTLALVQMGDEFELLPSVKGLGAVEAFLTARVAIYRWQYHHYNVVFHDLLLKLIVSGMLRDGERGPTGRDYITELSFEAFLRSDTDALSGEWPIIDDALVLQWLGQLREILKAKPERTQHDQRQLLMIEEVLFRRKRRLVLWKDPIGYLSFAGVVRQVMCRQLADYQKVAEPDVSERLTGLWPRDLDVLEAILVPFRRTTDPAIGDLQAWLWAHGCPWTVVDFRELQPFRRGGGKKRLSEMHILGRSGEQPRWKSLSDVSSVLNGFGDADGKELRFFAYRLIPDGVTIPERAEAEKQVVLSRRELAEALVRWALTPSVAKALGIAKDLGL